MPFVNWASTVQVVAPKIAASEVGDAGQASWVSSLRAGLPRFVHELGELAYQRSGGCRTAPRRPGIRARPVIYQRSNLYLLSGAHVARQFGLPLIEEINAPYFHERSRHGGISLYRNLRNWAERRAWLARGRSHCCHGCSCRHGGRAGGCARPTACHAQRHRSVAALLQCRRSAGEGSIEPCQYTVLGFTGFVRDWNGLDTVLDQLARPEGRNWYLLIVGDGPARPGLEQRAHELGVASRVRFTGVVKRSGGGRLRFGLRHRAAACRERLRVTPEALRVHGAGPSDRCTRSAEHPRGSDSRNRCAAV